MLREAGALQAVSVALVKVSLSKSQCVYASLVHTVIDVPVADVFFEQLTQSRMCCLVMRLVYFDEIAWCFQSCLPQCGCDSAQWL